MLNRKCFNFYKSYFDVASELPPQDRDEFVWAIVSAQFTGELKEPRSKLARLMFLGQKHSLLKQLEGFKAATTIPTEAPPKAPRQGTPKAPRQQEQEQEQEQEKEQEKGDKIHFFGTKGSKHFAVKSKYLHDTSSVVYPDGFTEYLDAKQFGFRFQKPFMVEMFWKEWAGKVFNDDGHMNSVLLKIQNSTL